MASSYAKDYSTMSNYPRALSSIIISVGLLAVFITLASWILLSYPIGSVVQSYFYGVDNTREIDTPVYKSDVVGSKLPKPEGGAELGEKQRTGGSRKPDLSGNDSGEKAIESPPQQERQKQQQEEERQQKQEEERLRQQEEERQRKQEEERLRRQEEERQRQQEEEQQKQKQQEEEQQRKQRQEEAQQKQRQQEEEERQQQQQQQEQQQQPIVNPGTNESPEPAQNRKSMDDGSKDNDSPSLPESESTSDTASGRGPVDSECDLYHGEWFFDPAGPVYTNNTCPVITQMQNCLGNGRPDKEYENWRWKPSHCELPRFNATKFLELMSGKTLAFVGDSVARNQMESLLCLLWQVEVPKNRGNRHMQRWYFRSKSVMICRIWSSWLVHQQSEAFSNVPEGITKLHLDVPDETFMQFITNFDVIVMSSGHWFAKQSVYMLNNEIVGTQLWTPPDEQPMKINSVEAFGISVETILTAMVTHPNFTGLTIVRSYSPDHYEGGAWNTGGSCTGKVKPVLPGKLVQNEFTNTMHEKQVMGFYQAIKKQTNRSKLKLMDITEAFSYRHDGHPGPYRSPDPNKITKRGPDGRPPPQDCLHWCMPGPVDTWNELVLEIIRREFEGNKNSAL